jgi:hypothetical protein
MSNIIYPAQFRKPDSAPSINATDFGQVRKGDRTAIGFVVNERMENGERMVCISTRGERQWVRAADVGARP